MSTFTVSGNVGVGGAAIYANPLNNDGGVAISAGDGSYSFSAPNGTYTVAVVLAGYSFDPFFIEITVNNADVSGVNFTGSQIFKITGNVGAAGVDVTAVPLSGGYATISQSDGSFSISVPNGTYTVTPSPDGFTFSPSSISAIVSGADAHGVNFIATPNTVGSFDAYRGILNQPRRAQAPRPGMTFTGKVAGFRPPRKKLF